MANSNLGITSSSITWDVEETDVTRDEVAFVNIECKGTVSSLNCTLDTALVMVPSKIPISATGPVRLAYLFEHAELQKAGVRYGDGNIQVTAQYRKPIGLVIQGPGGGTGDKTSEDDKRNLRVAGTSQPILSHPVVRAMPLKERRRLKNLQEGDTRPNAEEDETKAWFNYDYVKLNPVDGEWSREVVFSTDQVTVGGVTASPADYAKILTAGIYYYNSREINYRWVATRDEPASNSELNSVGKVIDPPGAPAVVDRDWMYDGLDQTQITDSSYTLSRDFNLSGPGGSLKEIYAGGSASINAAE